MRLRKSNQNKQFKSLLSFDLSDDDQPAPPRRGSDPSDEEFIVDAQQQLDDQDERDAEPQDLSDFESLNGKQPESGRKKNRRSWAPDATKPLNEVQPYPTDPSQKWTRTYVGPVKRWTRLADLVDYWFGDKLDCRKTFDEFMKLWWNFELLPPKLPQDSRQLQRAQNSWMPDNFIEDLDGKFCRWYERYLSTRDVSQSSTLIDKTKAFRWFIPQADGNMSVLLGHISDQKEYIMKQRESIAFSDSGIPIAYGENQESQNGGWLLDVGGIVLSMAWAPLKGQVDQLLAMAVIPHSDQAFHRDLNDVPNASELKEGAVQIWKCEVEKDSNGVLRPALSSPKLAYTICFHWGRPLRMQWCPVPPTFSHGVALLAVLCADGKLRVIEIKRDQGNAVREVFEELQEPMIAIEPPKEYTLEINCFAWLNMNRIAVALSDGSVTIWSLSPRQQLQRHPIHSSPIMDIVSGYPSSPFIVATVPMGGVLTLTDLNRPTAEKTYHGNPLISLQPNLLSWNDHIGGFASIWPSSYPGTSSISFVHSRVFPLSRHICTVDGLTSCLTFGTCHPFLLAGGTDGSVWILNVMRKIASHRQTTHKLKLFQHEYHPTPLEDTANEDEDQPAPRGACRILHGFRPQVNIHPLGTRIAKESRVKRARKDKKKKAQKEQEAEVSDDPGEVDEDNIVMAPGPIIIHDPLTRITAVSWNPNAEFGWWAAVAMGSGLVRIMDLGVERSEDISDEDNESLEQAELGDDMAEEFDEGYDGPTYEDEMEED
ncbi:WD40 repeat-like protein [Hypoxylon trugodes]|uniref:WD40 repeat-like protein n=1 Tax=Hypoxylon trugodes TaxID=326681 RepID=UPI00219B9506|nr:WD40 repeat-like protein [Hypoxylon trugodes]KAI1383325.1 WD40 repeat-like protein [Hypoxylon trugodes]